MPRTFCDNICRHQRAWWRPDPIIRPVVDDLTNADTRCHLDGPGLQTAQLCIPTLSPFGSGRAASGGGACRIAPATRPGDARQRSMRQPGDIIHPRGAGPETRRGRATMDRSTTLDRLRSLPARGPGARSFPAAPGTPGGRSRTSGIGRPAQRSRGRVPGSAASAASAPSPWAPGPQAGRPRRGCIHSPVGVHRASIGCRHRAPRRADTDDSRRRRGRFDAPSRTTRRALPGRRRPVVAADTRGAPRRPPSRRRRARVHDQATSA